MRSILLSLAISASRWRAGRTFQDVLRDEWYRRWARAGDKYYTAEYRQKVLAERNIQP